MIIKLYQPHALNLGTDLEYISTFIKGKRNSERKIVKAENIRLLLRSVNTGKEFIFGLELREDFFGKDRYSIFTLNEGEYSYIDDGHIKNQVYNYYYKSDNTAYVHKFFKKWLESDPMVHVGNYQHQFVSVIKNYGGSYEFDNKIY